MLKIKLITFIFYFILINNVIAEVVNKIEIKGNKRVSSETIKVYGQIKPLNSDFSASDINNILTNLYETNFFENIDIEIKNNVLKINLVEYPLINQIIIIGELNSNIQKQIKDVISLKEKNSFIRNNLNNDINLIKNLYSSIGYKFAKIDSKVRKIDENNYDIALEISKGDLTKIKKIYFIGDKKIKERRLRDVIVSEESKFWKVISKNTRFSENQISLDERLLLNYYKSLGYYDVKINTAQAEILNSSDVNLTFSINAGKRFTFNKIETIVDSTFDKSIFFPLENIYREIIGDYYSPTKVTKVLKEIDQLIAENNLQFVEHEVIETITNDEINLKFNIREGQKVLVERINIKGNNVTNESVIRSELLLDEGDPFTDLNLDKSIAKLKSRNIFKTVKSSTLTGSKNDLKIIDIYIEEKPTGEISAGAGVGTSGGTIAFNVTENNWLGEGKQVGVDFEMSEESLKGQFTYTNPNYDFLGNSVSYSIRNTTNDKPDQGYENSIFGIGASTKFEQFNNVFANLGINLSYDDLRTTSNASSSLQKQSGEFSELSASYGLLYDRRDRSFMPTSGSVIAFNQILPIYADKPFIDNTITASFYNSFSENYIGSSKFLISAITGIADEDVRISKRKTLSTRRLRGFERGKVGPVDSDDHIGGNYSASANFDLSLPNFLPESSNTDVSLFLDFANVWGVDYDDTIDDGSKLRSSTGLSASWISPIGPMTFTLSQNLSKASTDKTESFNFNLGTTF
ncbi:MAG: outer membrane protein assembly factor BamA [Candidatus Pelagibacter sp. TMED286]|nr:MAG: outer membrane protein assembly factor BamA [Candidatus Pelagibacter sp. TMED286]